jgi:hypothetical protein
MALASNCKERENSLLMILQRREKVEEEEYGFK